ncbi:ribonuclease P protein component [Fictibacillus aquaticus]|uniref:Ribonuclease P protein component n=1 Tax=Fictibacillus aquaticus TaxID=2021314 RepID=A0A235F711_9BACL|nr:ribonuclease P protein component [Fictibacillus aquaticus]OYD57126.1 ribonuclease P protein component [Fictibacillus aquaticus]
MKKQQRIKKNDEFQEVFKKGKSTANRQFVIYVLKREGQSEFRVGLSVSKKVGNAVTRNRIKRMIKEMLLKHKDQIHQGADYVIIARMPAADMDFHEIEKSLQHVMGRARVIRQSKERRK